VILSRIKELPPRALWICFCMFLVSIGAFLVIPIFAVFLNQKLHLSAGEIGWILSAKLVCAWGGVFLGGLVTDKLGPRWTMMLAFFSRTLAYLMIVFANSFWMAFFGSALIGLGVALFSPASKTALIHLVGRGRSVVALSIRETATNLGAALGPLLGIASMSQNLEIFFFIGAALFFLLALATPWLVPETHSQMPKDDHPKVNSNFLHRSLWKEYRGILSPTMWVFTVLFFLFSAYYAQVELTMPLYAAHLFKARGPFLLFTANAVVVSILQVPLSTRLSVISTQGVLISSLMAVGLGFFFFGISNQIPLFLFGVVLFSIGETLFGPRLEAEASALVSAKSVGKTLGFLGIGSGIGAAFGSVIGGHIFQNLLEKNEAKTFWIYGGLGMLPVAFISLLIWRAMDSNQSREREI